ncbi:MAG: hypothetical protein IJ335_05480 [Lachnospiraceae bacterium]|nr:hypothetical protein [Lachnospiraceae bacterium]
MEVIYILLGLLILWMGYLYARFLSKRIICCRKLKSICKAKGFQLHRNHMLWFLGGRNGKKCDCYIESPTSVMCIKLFGVVPRLRTLVFVEERAYFLRRHMGMLLFLNEKVDGESRELPGYDFYYKGKDSFPEKKRYHILLVNPVPVEMLHQFDNGQEVILNPGDKIRDMEVYNQSWLLEKLENLE